MKSCQWAQNLKHLEFVAWSWIVYTTEVLQHCEHYLLAPIIINKFKLTPKLSGWFVTSFLDKNKEKIIDKIREKFFSWILISKIGVKMNFRILTKNHAADSKIGLPQKMDFRAARTHESNSTAWELNAKCFF